MKFRANRLKKPCLLASAAWLAGTAPAMAASGEEVSPLAHELFHIGPLPVTNSMVTTWFFSIVLIVALRLAVGTPRMIPSRGQAVVESMIKAVRDIIEPIVGPRMVKPTFPLLFGFFIFILIMNWSGLLPGVGTFGLVEEEEGHKTLLYFFRPATSDLNTTLALTIVSFTAWLYFILRYAGLRMVIYDIFGNKANKKEVPPALYYSFFIVFFFVGVVESVSILSRLLSLSFRLFGNVFGGENLLNSMHGVFRYLLPVPFYGLEIVIGLLQAFVFTVLTAVYIGLICNHEGGHDEKHDEEHGAASHEDDVKVAAHN